MTKPDRATLLSNAAIAVGFVLLLVGVAWMGDPSPADVHAQSATKHSSHAPAVVFWVGVALFVGGCLMRAWRF